jgi:hypothetical protein
MGSEGAAMVVNHAQGKRYGRTEKEKGPRRKRQPPPHPNQEALNAQRAAATEHLRKVLSDAARKLRDAKTPS